MMDANGWMPIETAPKDGTDVDLWATFRANIAPQRFADCHCDFGEWVVWTNSEDDEGGWTVLVAVTHWRPIPASPEQENAQ